jgi:hypothetical protein
MQADRASPPPGPGSGSVPDRASAEWLERGNILVFPVAPFPLPAGDDLDYLLRQRVAGITHKNVTLDPATGRLTGFIRREAGQAERLRALLAGFSRAVCGWLAQTFPHYARTATLDRVSYRPEEEATRRLRHMARNDLLHIDAFPNRPAQGRRILRVFANVNPTDPRVWVTSEPLAVLLDRFGAAVAGTGFDSAGWFDRLGQEMVRVLRPARPQRTRYDLFMLRFHDFLKRCEEFQERGRKRLWTFGSGSAWAVFTDACSHAELRGRHALEHSFFIGREGLVLPGEAPAALLERLGRGGAPRRAA